MNITKVNKHLQFISSSSRSKVECYYKSGVLCYHHVDVTLFSELIFILLGDFLFLVHWPRVTLILVVPQNICDNILVLLVVIFK